MRRTTDTKAAKRGVNRMLAIGLLSLFAAPMIGPDSEMVRESRRRRRKARRGRKRSLLSSRLGPLDPRPTTGGRNAEWKKFNAEVMEAADVFARKTGGTFPGVIEEARGEILRNGTWPTGRDGKSEAPLIALLRAQPDFGRPLAEFARDEWPR